MTERATVAGGSRLLDRLMVSADEAAALIGIERSTWASYVASGRAPQGVKLGGSRRWSVALLARWVDAGCPNVERFEEMEARRG